MTTFTLDFNPEECGICYDTQCDIHITTRCGHEMCSDCYNSLQSTTCPYCRQQLNIEPNPFTGNTPTPNPFTGISSRRIAVWPEPEQLFPFNIDTFHALSGNDRLVFRLFANELPEIDNTIENIERPIQIVNFHYNFINN